MNAFFSRFSFLLVGTLIFASTVFGYALPEEVQNLTASEKNGAIYLEWNPGFSAEDVITSYKIYYGVNSVQTENDFYDNEILTGVETSYLFDSLEKGVEYFFAVTALDSQENESGTYSKEVSFMIPLQNMEIIEEPIVEEEEPVIEEPIIIEEEPEPIETSNEGEVEASQSIDTTPPTEATKLSIDSSEVAEGKAYLLWERSNDTDVIDQVLFLKKGFSSWDGGVSLGKNIEKIDIEVEPNQNYQARIVTVDNSGNESGGVSISFSTTLGKTGADSLIPFLLGGIFLVFLLFSNFRRQR